MEIQNVQSNNPVAHVQNIEKSLSQLKEHCRDDVRKIEDPKAKALFETTAEVLGGLEKAFHDFQSKSEDAWKKS